MPRRWYGTTRFLGDPSMSCLSEQARSGHAVTCSESIDPLQGESGDGDVDALHFQIVRDLDRSDKEGIAAIYFVNRGWSRDIFVVLQQPLDMKSQRLLGHCNGLIERRPRGHAAGKIRKRDPVIAVGVLMDKCDIGGHGFTAV